MTHAGGGERTAGVQGPLTLRTSPDEMTGGTDAGRLSGRRGARVDQRHDPISDAAGQ